MIFDTHAHYDDEAFDADREELLKSLPGSGIGAVVNMGASMRGSRASIALANTYDHMYGAVGIHPDDCGPMEESWIGELRELAADRKCAAIGEIGLDYHGFGVYEDKPPKEVQQKWFWRQLQLAAELSKPVVIHSRNACEDTLLLMQKAHEELGIEKAVIHCFSYAKETAARYLEMGFYLGFGGTLTYEGQKKLTKVLEITPPDRILLETDCPYLAPAPRKGERNDSRNLTFVRDKAAEVKQIPPAELEQLTWENACRFYGIRE